MSKIQKKIETLLKRLRKLNEKIAKLKLSKTTKKKKGSAKSSAKKKPAPKKKKKVGAKKPVARSRATSSGQNAARTPSTPADQTST